MRLFNFWSRRTALEDERQADAPRTFTEAPPGTQEETGEGGPSLFVADLNALRSTALIEAERLGQSLIEPEQWENGRLLFEYERHLAHEHEGIRDRLANYVAARVRDMTEEIHGWAMDVAVARDRLVRADAELATVLHSWRAAYRDVHEDELELGRYVRLKSPTYQGIKLLIAALLFAAEFAVSTALFDRVVAQDIPVLPLLFALGLILVLIVVPHYSAIAIKDGLIRHHDAEMRAYDEDQKPPPVRVRQKAHREEVDDRGIKFASAVVGLALVGLVIPLSSLRATELGNEEHPYFWFSFFLLLQLTISGYFFVREWMDHGAASVNLKQNDSSRGDAERARLEAFEEYANAVTTFNGAAELLLFFHRAAPQWDSHIVSTYFGTLHAFRHALVREHPELDVFISHATIPLLSGPDHASTGEPDCGRLPMSVERPDLTGHGPLSRERWLAQVFAAGSARPISSSLPAADTSSDSSRPGVDAESDGRVFRDAGALLDELMRHKFGFSSPYEPPAILTEIAEIELDSKGTRVHHNRLASTNGSSSGVFEDHAFGSNGRVGGGPVRLDGHED